MARQPGHLNGSTGSEERPDEAHVAACIRMIDYLVGQIGNESPFTAHLLHIARENLAGEADGRLPRAQGPSDAP